MKARPSIRIQNLEFLPLVLIVIYKMAIQTNANISYDNKMVVMYVFIGISSLIFGYLLLYKKPTWVLRMLSLLLVIALIFISCYLIYFKK